MQKRSDKEIRNLFLEAKRLAAVCLNTESTLPSRDEIIAVGNALLAAGLVSVGKPVRAVDRGGQSSTGDQLLSDVYDERN